MSFGFGLRRSALISDWLFALFYTGLSAALANAARTAGKT